MTSKFQGMLKKNILKKTSEYILNNPQKVTIEIANGIKMDFYVRPLTVTEKDYLLEEYGQYITKSFEEMSWLDMNKTNEYNYVFLSTVCVDPVMKISDWKKLDAISFQNIYDAIIKVLNDW